MDSTAFIEHILSKFDRVFRMTIVADHSILPSRNKKESSEFYTRIFGFVDLGEEPGSGLHGVRVTDSFILFFEDSSDGSSWAQGIHHFAFGISGKEFDQVFERIRSSGIPYGNHYSDPTNMKPPRMAPGARGQGRSIYFRDPSGNLLQILNYSTEGE